MHDPAKQWEQFGRVDPYYGVYSTEEFRRENLDEAARERFFASGSEHVAGVLELARRAAGPDFAPSAILDHGCGVGRLVVPFADHAERVVGVDVSPSMLAEARRNCDARGVDGVDLVTADRLGTLAPEFDLVHSFIVLQHIPPELGMPIIATLATRLRPGGVGVLHLPIAARDRRTRVHTWVMHHVPFAANLANLARRRPWSYPHMQMNVYDLNAIAQQLGAAGFEHVGLELHPSMDAVAYASCTLVFVRPPGPS